MKARICIIGNGSFANKVHYPSLISLDDAEIVGICAFDEERLKQTAFKFGIPDTCLYIAKSRTDYRGMLLALKPDGVYVIGQPGAMLDVWIWCLQNRFNLYIEKPMGVTLHQAQLLARLAEDNGCITQVSYQRRCSPLLQHLHAACTKKGAVTSVIVEFSKYEITPMIGERDRMLDDYIHAVDTARYLCGGDVVKISSSCRRLMVTDINCIEANLQFDNGSSCYVLGNWTAGRRVFRVGIHAPGISADIEPEKEGWLYETGNYEGVKYDSQTIAGSNELFIYGGFQQKSREFINSILKGINETSTPFSDALKTMQVCETILAQALLTGA